MSAAPAAPDTSPPPVKKPGFMTLVKAIAVISVLVLLQLVAVAMLVPTPQETAHIAEQLIAADAAHEAEESENAAAKHGEASQDKGKGAHGGARTMNEVKLGSYHVVTFNTETGTSLNIDFELYGTVLAKEEEDFSHRFEANKVRIREQVLVTVRGSEISDLSDPDLGLLKRKILEKVNRTLGKPLVSEAIFSKFSFIER